MDGIKVELEKPILHEEDEGTKAVIESWFERARNIRSISEAAEFADHVINYYYHDYGTICYAISAAAVAMASGADHEPGARGGITGFQAGCVMWGFVRHWNYSHNKTGLRIVDFDNMLYPQYEYKFQKTISKEVWESLQEEAKNLLADADPYYTAADVFAHWKSIVNGEVPFGYTVVEE